MPLVFIRSDFGASQRAIWSHEGFHNSDLSRMRVYYSLLSSYRLSSLSWGNFWTSNVSIEHQKSGREGHYIISKCLRWRFLIVRFCRWFRKSTCASSGITYGGKSDRWNKDNNMARFAGKPWKPKQYRLWSALWQQRLGRQSFSTRDSIRVFHITRVGVPNTWDERWIVLSAIELYLKVPWYIHTPRACRATPN